MNKVKVYACGGCGSNIAKELWRPMGDTDPGFAEVSVVFIDTSRSNLLKLPEEMQDSFFHIRGGLSNTAKDGSGMVRDTNYQPIKAAIPEILHDHEPGTVNIVIHSTSGGSGAVIAGVLVSELLSMNQNVVVLMVGSVGCEKEIHNTIQTVKSYQSIATTRKMPVIAKYVENGVSSMEENDAAIKVSVLMLAALFSGTNHGIDTQDLSSFLNYTRVCKHQPALASLEINIGTELKESKGQAIPTVISLTQEGENHHPGVIPSHHCFGIASQEATEALKVTWPLHFSTNIGSFTERLLSLEALNIELQERARTNPVQHIVVDASGGDDGLIL